MKTRTASFGDFTCSHCRSMVFAAHFLSGVHNRNHCPYCLWSCHLDLFAAGDRLSACKGQMKPIGLTMKKGRNKYRREARGELMLVHQCVECYSLSINRIAADDDPSMLMDVFHSSLALGHGLVTDCEQNGISVLKVDDAEIIQAQLYGQHADFHISI
ncbi:MAG: RNHCP domain-containing protein [Chloroflexota bacterium]